VNTELPGKLFDGVFRRVLGDQLSAELRARLAADGLDLDALRPKYPRSVWYGAVSRTAADLFPGEAAAGQRRLGQHVIALLQQRNLIKGAWLGVAKLAGPRRALRQAADHVEHSPIHLTIVEKAKTEFEILVDELEQPEFLAGLLEGAIGMLGGRDAKAIVQGPRGALMVLSATWR
jgi:uncharacterized protein (TIGR02265 family)